MGKIILGTILLLLGCAELFSVDDFSGPGTGTAFLAGLFLGVGLVIWLSGIWSFKE